MKSMMMVGKYFQQGHSRVKAALAAALFLAGASAQAGTPTVTTLTVTPSGTSALGQSVTLKASVTVAGLTQIVAGEFHSCALMADTTVKCWGDNDYGQLGDGTTTDRLLPVPVKNVSGAAGDLSGVTALEAGNSHTCALLFTGQAVCWGYNDYGQLGDGTTTNRSAPVFVNGVGGGGTLNNVTALAAGYGHTCAVISDGTARCWGWNSQGQLGDGTTTDRSAPVFVKGVGGMGNLTNVTALAAGVFHTCAMIGDHTARCWGDNGNGQLGDGTGTQHLTPVFVKGVDGIGNLTNVTMLEAGYFHTCAVIGDDTARCWGGNGNGQLGDGTGTQHLTPVFVKGVDGIGNLTNVTMLEAGYTHTCAVRGDGTARCWGWNEYGQLGDGQGGDLGDQSLYPVIVKGVEGSGNLTGVASLAAGYSHTCAVIGDGTARCWGRNEHGALGDGTGGNFGDQSLLPVAVNFTVPTASVNFYRAGNLPLGSETLGADGTAEIILPGNALLYGQHSLTATYAGTPTHDPSTSAMVAHTVTATSGDDPITGTNGDDPIDGLGGDDTINGLGGNDTIDGGEGNDTLDGGDGSDELYGGDGSDKLYAGNGADTLDGGTGADEMVGGAGDDTYYVDDMGDQVIETADEGYDVVYTTLAGYTAPANVEKVYLAASPGNDTLAGTSGPDSMAGGAGDDTYVVDNAGDEVLETGGAGEDTVEASINYVLPANVENLTLTGTGDLTGTGNGLANVLTGNAGKNKLDGGAGADTMTGAAGDDVYVVDDTGDKVVELPNQGTDTVEASISYTLPANVEKLTLTGTGNINGTGNGLANVLTGNAGRNVLKGGLGKDSLTGGAGADKFVFTSPKDSPVKKSKRDVILDFTSADKIDLRGLDANAKKKGKQRFSFIGAKGFTRGKSGQLRYAKGVLYGEVTGDGRADFAITVKGAKVTGKRLILR